MESFHIQTSSDNLCSQSYIFSPEDLADIPHPDEICGKEGNLPLEDSIELPLPPGTSSDDFAMPLQLKHQSLNSSGNSSPFAHNEGFENSSNLGLNLISDSFNVIPFDGVCRQKPDLGADEFQNNILNKTMVVMDDSKYSPSKVDSDEENQDFVTIKPKVLGKEQAKKRLMAFSLSKQPSTSIKKQSKTVTPAKNKEKPPNPNKGTNVQEQFRATISAIEEEKKKMFQNMPNYLLQEMSDLVKSSHSLSSPFLQILEKLKNENSDPKSKDGSSKDGCASNKSRENLRSKRRSYRTRSRSNSRNKSKKRRRSRSKRRSRSRSKRSRSRRSQSRSRGSGNHNKRPREEKNYKTENKTARESQSRSKKILPKDWSSYKAAGLNVENESKNWIDEAKPRREKHSRRSRSPNTRADFKPIFNYLNESCNLMTPLQARPVDSSNSVPVLFSEKTVKFTRTKPILTWAENPNHATEFFMSKQMLLENCDQSTATILEAIIGNKNIIEKKLEDSQITSRPWYPRDNYLLMNMCKDLELNKSHAFKKSFDNDNEFEKNLSGTVESKTDVFGTNEDGKNEETSLEKKISLVNDSYLSDEEDQVKEMVMGEVKVQLDLDINSVKVRSKWDSDYEGENNDKESALRTENNKDRTAVKIHTKGSPSDLKEKITEDIYLKYDHQKMHGSFEKKKSAPINSPTSNVTQVELPNSNPTNMATGDLVSEYEEFLKMVSVDSGGIFDNQKEKTIPESNPKPEKQKQKKNEKLNEENQTKSPKAGVTDWDQESEHEEKSTAKKMQFSNNRSQDEFLILRGEKLEGKRKKKLQKKNEKVKETKIVLKKFGKIRKKKCEDSYSEESSSESYDSDSSDSDSTEGESTKKKKKKKYSKTKKKHKKGSSSDSDSDSVDCKIKKKKSKQKKEMKEKNLSSDSDIVQTALLKQLAFKKQLIMKKIEEIDSISDRTTKKKEKESRAKQKEKDSLEDSDSEKCTKSCKKKPDVKIEKYKKISKIGNKKIKLLQDKTKKIKKSKSSSESDSETSEDSSKKKKIKKLWKKKRDSSESSINEEKPKKSNKSKASGKTGKKIKRLRKDSSSDSDTDDSVKGKKNGRNKKDKVKSNGEKLTEATESNFMENLLLNEPDVIYEKPLACERKKLWKKSEKQSRKKKEDDDWEASSSVEESEKECKTRESSWNDEVTSREAKAPISENDFSKADMKSNNAVPKKQFGEASQNNFDVVNQLGSGSLKTSLSVFSFNENSFCSFGQELSRDFFLAESNYSNLGNMSSNENLRITAIEPRPFQSVSKDSEIKTASHSELYSPGHSDSESSDMEVNKPEKFIAEIGTKEEAYDPLNCDSEGSIENNEVELSSIPLPRVSEILLPGETRNLDIVLMPSNLESNVLKDIMQIEGGKSDIKLPFMTPPPLKSCFTSSDFTPVARAQSPFNHDKATSNKKQLMSVKGQSKLVSKAASVFQDESDEENIEPPSKGKTTENNLSKPIDDLKERIEERQNKESNNKFTSEEKAKDEIKRQKSRSRNKSREKSVERDVKKKRSTSRERRSSSRSKSYSKKAFSPRPKKSRTPDLGREKREIRSDSFEIEPLKSCIDPIELTELVQPIPVLTGLETNVDGLWNRSLIPGCEFPHTSDNVIEDAESFDIYPSEESSYRNRNYDKGYPEYQKGSSEKSKDQKSKKERRKSRSRSYSPKKKLRSKSPEKRKSPRNRSPRRKSASPKRKEKSPFSPRRRSPKRKSPFRRYKNSRSPDKRRKSRSRSPRKRRNSPSKRSRSDSPRKHRSPKYHDESPRRRDSPATAFSPRDRFSPRKDCSYSYPYPGSLHNRIPVIGASGDDIERDMSPSVIRSPLLENSIAFPRHIADSSVHETDMYNSFYESEYTGEFGMTSYPEEVSVNNLITVKNHDLEKTTSSERLTLDQRIELELGVPLSTSSLSQSDQYQMCPQFQDTNYFQNSCNCDSANVSSENFYQNQNLQINDFNGQYFNGHQQQSDYVSFQQYSSTQPVQNSVLQVGNIVEVVPTLQHPPNPLPPLSAKAAPQIMQVGNVLQVVPSQKPVTPVPPPVSQNYGPSDGSPMVKTQKATAVVAPSSIIPTPNPEAVLSPLIKAIQLEREKRKREKEKRKAEREARRKARQLRREAKLMLVNEKLKKSVQNEGLMLGQEVEDDELLDGLDIPSPPIPVEIITVSSPSALPPAGKGILITAGFKPKPPSEKKEVKFADGVCPGEGTSTSGGEDITSPPPKPKLPKEKRFKKRKTKVKKKVKVQIIRQIIQEEDDDEDDLSPPPPPPGDPPPVFFARFPFAGEAQFPVYQTQTTTTTLTTLQYQNQSFE